MSGSIKLKHASGNGVIIAAPSSNPAALQEAIGRIEALEAK